MVGADARERLAAAVDRGDRRRRRGRRSTGATRTNGPAGADARPDDPRPTADHESELAREELFGPVLGLLAVDDLDDALEFVNGSRYGNASVDLHHLGRRGRARYRYEVEAGMLGVNIGVPAPVAWFPFAGWKDSCDGDLHANGARRDRVLHAQEGRDDALVAARRSAPGQGRWGGFGAVYDPNRPGAVVRRPSACGSSPSPPVSLGQRPMWMPISSGIAAEACG